MNSVTKRDSQSEVGVPEEDAPTPRCRLGRRKALVAASGAAIVLLIMLGVLYSFGTPQTPSSAGARPAGAGAGISDSSAGANSPAAGYAERVDPGALAPPADPASPLAIEIPGCVCHSEDPALVKSHSEYRMNQCAGCHIAGVSMGR